MALRVSFFALLALIFIASSSAADTLRVPEDYASPQAAVNAAQDGDTIRIGDGEYGGFSISGRTQLSVRGRPGHLITGNVSVSDSSGVQLETLRVEGGISVSDSIATAVSRCRVFGGTIYASDGSGLFVERNRIEDALDGIFLDEVDGFTVRRNIVKNAGAAGILAFGGQGKIKGNKVVGGASGAAIDASGESLKVIKNRIEDVLNVGIAVSGTGHRIDGNEVLTAGGDALLCTSGGNHRFENNLVKRARDGVDIKAACSSNQVSGNKIKKMTGDGIDLDSSGNVATGNIIKGTGDTGIQLIASGNTVTGNTIRDTVGERIRDDVGGNTIGANN